MRDSGWPDKAENSAVKGRMGAKHATNAYTCFMTRLLEEAVEKIRALPEADQDIAAELLLGFADPDAQRTHLTPEQAQDVERARDEARQGKFASAETMQTLWRRFGL